VELEDVFRAYQRSLFAYFVHLAGNVRDAEELTQETFVRACGAAVRFRGDSSVRTWLFGIAHRVFLEAARSGLFENPSQIEERPGVQEDLDERLDLERAFASLQLVDRETLMLVDVLGFEPIEAARMVRVSPEAFRVRLHRARARLRQRYLR
jgi:RNA polymerase sigma-70 factor (ECF subfamily)